MRIVSIICTCIVGLPWVGNGQNYSVYNSYLINPYLYNPAEAASENMNVFVDHRIQWTGIDGSPTVSTATFNSLIDLSRVGIGAKISSYKRGLLNTTDAQFSLAYGVPFSRESAIFFGMSGGMISRGLDQSKVFDPNDPAIASYLAEKIAPAASAGLLLKSGTGLNFGIALPQLLERSIGTELNPQTSLSPFNQIWFTTYYRRKVEGRIVTKKTKGMKSRAKVDGGYAPLEFYATYKLSAYQTSQAEAQLKLNLSQNFWLTAGYRQSYGLLTGLGFSVQKFLFNYSFEPGGQPQKGFSTGTHEFLAGLRIGDEKRLRRKAVVIRSTLSTTTVTHNPRLKHSVTDPDELEKESTEEVGKKKYLVVTRIFTDLVSADEYKKKLIEQKYNADIYYYAKDKRFYVHIFQSTNAREANQEIKNLKLYTKLKDIKLITINEE